LAVYQRKRWQKNAVLKGIENDLKKQLNSRASLLESLSSVINQMLLWGPKLRDRIVKNKTTVYDIETVTFQEKGILDIISAFNFFNRYASIVLDIIITETDKEVNLTSFLSKVDINFFNNTNKYFSHLIVKFSQSVNTLEKIIDNISEEIYDPTAESIIRSQLGDDGVGVRNLAPHELNPKFYFRMYQMKKDIKKIISSNAEIDMLAMKIARLNNRKTGTEDPNLEHQIEKYQDELIKNQSRIAAIEAKYGD